MDKYNLLFFTMGKMDDENSASSGKVPGTVSRKRKTDDPKSSSKKTKPVDREQLQLQRKMASNVARIGNSVEIVAYGTLASQQESLQDKIFNLKMRKLECTNAMAESLIGERISQLEGDIEQIEETINGRSVRPKTIDFSIRDTAPSASSATNNVDSLSALDSLGANSGADYAVTTPPQDESV